VQNINSVLNRGNSDPGGRYNALVADWLKAADVYYDASMRPSAALPRIPVMWVATRYTTTTTSSVRRCFRIISILELLVIFGANRRGENLRRRSARMDEKTKNQGGKE
jgi:hypothetical protein